MGGEGETSVMYLFLTIQVDYFFYLFKDRHWGILLEESQNEVEDNSTMEMSGSQREPSFNSIY